MRKIVFIFWCFVVAIVIAILLMVDDYQKTKRIEDILLSGEFIDAKTFLKVRKEKTYSSKNGYHSNSIKFKGVYVLKNVDSGKCYVGQSKDVLNRVFSHLSGSGNGDVYADFKYGSNFSVVTLPFVDSKFNNLNEMERVCIDYFDSAKNGYNKTKGNR